MEKMQKIANDKNWKALIKPSKVDVKTYDSKSIATITAEPLEKGYGLTIGNSLRRIMLSSILSFFLVVLIHYAVMELYL